MIGLEGGELTCGMFNAELSGKSDACGKGISSSRRAIRLAGVHDKKVHETMMGISQ